MPKSSRGGKAGATTTYTIRQPQFHPVTNPRPTPQPTPQPVQQQTQTLIQQNQPSANFAAFKQMTDDQKADVILQLRSTQVPSFLAQNDTQRIMYGLQMNDKPTLVSDSVLDTIPGKDLFRTVNGYYDKSQDINYGADSIANQVIKGRATRVSDSGGSAYGRGVYFADNYYDSTYYYGQTKNDISKTAVVRAKLSPTAKTIGTRSAAAQAVKEIKSGSKLGNAIKKLGLQDKTSIWALAKGYDAMVAPNGYHVVINRSALIASNSIRPWNNTHNW